MGLEKVFSQAEQPFGERKLEVVSSEGIIFDEWKCRLSQIPLKMNVWRETFNDNLDYLKSFEIKPARINNFNKKIKNVHGNKKESFGIFLSALVQTSYNQGFNNFDFGTINAGIFGGYLKGAKGNPIKIRAGKISGYNTFNSAENCSLTAKVINGDDTLENATGCSLTAEKIQGDFILYAASNCSLTTETLIGDDPFWAAEGCVAEITNYHGNAFGLHLKNCQIYSPNQQTLENLQRMVDCGENNIFVLGTLQQKR
ncbi:hypothetical protein HY643_04190 [Candidatus Woesearchaeota archaeon]|nr:hypothetical protein [Candidatus Woesearchaeota archaeon]